MGQTGDAIPGGETRGQPFRITPIAFRREVPKHNCKMNKCKSLLAGLIFAGLIAGCGSLTPATKTYKANVATVTTANTALVAWQGYLEVKEADLIKQKKAGVDVTAKAQALDDLWDKASALWSKYQAAQAVAFSVNRSMFTSTNTAGVQLALIAAAAAEQDFIKFINSITK